MRSIHLFAGVGGGYSQTSFLDTVPSVPSNGRPTPAESFVSAPLTDGSLACTCTKETFGCSIHPRGRDEWIACMQDSLARILASLDPAQGSMANAAAYTAKCSASLTWLDRHSSSWRTHQQSLDGGLVPFCETWPRAGTMLAGQCWALPMWARPISVIGGGVWHPTPLASDGQKMGHGNLGHWVKLHPTIVARDYKSPHVKRTSVDRGYSPNLPEWVGGNLSPTWAEWVNAYPLGWTASKESATAKSRSAPPSPGASSEGRDP
jgi:hypothetical protein